MKIAIIIPTLRERNNLQKLIPAVFHYAPEADLLIVDDYSNDGTRELVENFKREYPNLNFLERREQHGYGRAISAGLRWASRHGAERIITMDADFSHDPKEIPSLLAKLDSHDVVIGSRYVLGGGIQSWGWHRRLLSWFAQRYVRLILGSHFRDSTTGFTGYGRRALAHLVDSPPRSDGYSFLVECKYSLQRADCTISEHPVVYTGRREEESKMSWRNIWEAIWMPWHLRRK